MKKNNYQIPSAIVVEISPTILMTSPTVIEKGGNASDKGAGIEVD